MAEGQEFPRGSAGNIFPRVLRHHEFVTIAVFYANGVMFCAFQRHQFSIFEVMGGRQPWDCVLNLSQHAKNITFYYINTNEILGELLRKNLISSHVKITCYLQM